MGQVHRKGPDSRIRRRVQARFLQEHALMSGWFTHCCTLALLATGAVVGVSRAQSATAETSIDAFLKKHCLDCHNREEKKGGLALDAGALDDLARRPEAWERVVR